jgi:hypothetical protein
MIDTVLAILGILVSFGLFFVGYRQTVGAKKERITSCNSELEKILVKRVVLETYSPARVDARRLIEGKARDFRVNIDEVLSEAQVLNAVYTRIIESDLIPADQRHVVLNRVIPALAEAEARPSDEEATTGTGRDTKKQLAISLMAIMASVTGALFSVLPEVVNLDTAFPSLFKTVTFTAIASLAAISLWVVVNRVRASQEDLPTQGRDVNQYIEFEREVARTMRSAGYRLFAVPPGRSGDFLVESNGRKILVEVKLWPRRVPAQVIAGLADRVRQSANELGADEAIIVTRNPILEEAQSMQTPGVELLSLKHLKPYLAQRSKGPSAA